MLTISTDGKEHAFASRPTHWPLALKGVAYWLDAKSNVSYIIIVDSDNAIQWTIVLPNMCLKLNFLVRFFSHKKLCKGFQSQCLLKFMPISASNACIHPQKMIFRYIISLEKLRKKVLSSMLKLFSNQKISNYHYLDFHTPDNQKSRQNSESKNFKS